MRHYSIKHHEQSCYRFSNHWMKTLGIVGSTQRWCREMQDKKLKVIYIYQIWLTFVFISFNHLEVTVSPFLFFFLFSSQWLHLRLTFSWTAPHVSRAVAIQCVYYYACLFHQYKTVKIFTKTGTSRPDIYFCKKVLDYQVLTEDVAKINDINSQIVLLKDHKVAT